MHPLISICMPNYNGDRFIGEAIDSVLAQTYENFELVIIDDASTDSSRGIIRNYKDPRIKFFPNKKNIHTSRSVNKAIQLSGGEIIAILHSDDKYEPNYLEEIVKAYERYPDQKIFVTGVYFYHSDTGELKSWHPYDSGGIKSQSEAIIRLSLNNNIGNGINVAINRKCFDRVGFFSEKYKYLADYDYWLRLAEKFSFVYIPKILTYYNIHESNTTHSIINEIIFQKEGLEVFKKNIFNSRVINTNTLEKILYLGRKQTIRKAFTYGIKYKSGKVIRDVLDFSKRDFLGIYLEPDYYFIYLLSYFLIENVPDIIGNLVEFLGKSVLYPNKIIIRHNLEKLIRNNNAVESF